MPLYISAGNTPLEAQSPPGEENLYLNITGWQTGSQTKTTLDSFTIPANTLDEDGKVLQIRAWGTMINAADGEFMLDLGATQILLIGYSSGGTFSCDAQIIRTGSSAAQLIARFEIHALGTASNFVPTLTEDLTTSLLLKVSGRRVAATNRIVRLDGWGVWALSPAVA